MTYRDALNDLAIALPFLGRRDHDFAQSLLSQAVANAELGNAALSQNQWFWVRKLASRGLPIEQTQAVDLSPINALFAQAGGKRSVLLFVTADDTQYRLSVAGPASQSPGTINVTDNGPGGFGGRTWFGRIGHDGAFLPSHKIAAETTTAVLAALQAFAANPAEQAARFGHRTGQCCFCARELTDERSVTVGYGPICADRWGLPWGE